MTEPIISFKHVKKDYRFYRNNHQRLWHEILRRDTGEVVNVLEDVSFEINKGEKVAIIGVAGSGRSTIMRLMGGIYKPDQGEIKVTEEPELIFDHRLGFNIGMSGRDNYHMRANILGWSKEKIASSENKIIEFAELEDLIDDPIKAYPTGSMTRLGFTIGTETDKDVILFDELFNVGGNHYLPKCIERLKELIEGEDKTFVMTVGNYPIAKQLCTRALVLDKGVICYDGGVNDAIKYFRANCKEDPEKEKAMMERMKAEQDDMDEDQDDFDMG